MSIRVQHRRGTTAEIAASVPAAGEFLFDTTKKTIVVGDGATVGGTPLAKESHPHPAFTGATSGAAGSVGFVPAPAAGQQARFLRGDGTWIAFSDLGLVRYDADQPLSDIERRQARANVGVAWEVISNQVGFAGQSQIVTSIPSGVRAIKATGTLLPSAAGLIYAQVSLDGGATWVSTGYATLIGNIAGSGVSSGGFNHAAIQVTSNIPTAANGTVSFELSLDSLKVPARKPRYRLWTSFEANGGGEYDSFVSGNIGSLAGSAVNGIRILAQSGTLSGDLLVEGIR